MHADSYKICFIAFEITIFANSLQVFRVLRSQWFLICWSFYEQAGIFNLV